MTILLILIKSLIIFITFRCLLIILNIIICNVGKIKCYIPPKFDIILSASLHLIFIGAYAYVVNRNINLDNLEWYIVYVIMGITSVIWCYYEWELKFKAKPIFIDKEKNAQKKALLFFIVLVFTFYFGYVQILKLVEEKPIDSIFIVTYYAIIAIIIAVDRFFNQIYNLYDYKKNKK